MSNTWAVSFHRDGNHLLLNQTADRYLLIETVFCQRWIERPLLRLPGGYRLWNRILCWTSSKEKPILKLPADKTMLAALAPDDEWLWGDDDA